MRNKAAVVVAVALATTVMLGAWCYFSPHLALSGMRTAARRGDAPALADYVDFPAVRASLKAALRAKAAEQAANGSPLAIIGTAFAGMVVDPMVDAMVTPRGLALLLSGYRPGDGALPPEGFAPSEPDVDVDAGYAGLSEFLVVLTPRASRDTPIGLVLRRSGPFSWKLSAVRLP